MKILTDNKKKGEVEGYIAFGMTIGMIAGLLISYLILDFNKEVRKQQFVLEFYEQVLNENTVGYDMFLYDTLEYNKEKVEKTKETKLEEIYDLIKEHGVANKDVR